ncbi:hypothetical protein ABEB36_004851 [Hypothenemus hampei]|uniref:U11/U12 small nuclear ribonucleoprotein 35 kDa protein n=1 Tax=Hypothenemus hampei TaxID=57062 RepID=A0ABD1EZY9_HYPHA
MMKLELDESIKSWSKYAKTYDPIKCASIDGTDSEPHDRAVVRAINSEYHPNRFVKGKPECTIFVSRLSRDTSKETIKEFFSKYGKLKRFRLVKDIVTGMPKGYAFIEYEDERGAEEAYRMASKMVIDGRVIFVDFECERLLKGWRPRRLGGGFGGKKESGQLRFGGRDRPFKKPIALELKEREERRLKEKSRKLRHNERYHHRRGMHRKSPTSHRDDSRHNSQNRKDENNGRSCSPRSSEKTSVHTKRHRSPSRNRRNRHYSSDKKKQRLYNENMSGYSAKIL